MYELYELIQKLPHLCLLLTPEGKILEASDTYLQMINLAREEVVGHTLTELFHIYPTLPTRIEAEALETSIQEALEQHASHTIEAQTLLSSSPSSSPTHEIIYWRCVHIPITNEQGQTLYLIHELTDLTETTKNNVSFTTDQNRERYRSIIATANDAFIAINQEGKIVEWNRQAELIFGWTFENIKDKTIEETIIPPSYRQAHRQGLAHYLETGEGPILNKRIELTALHYDGHEFPIELTVWTLNSNSGIQFYAFVHDITERKQLAVFQQAAEHERARAEEAEKYKMYQAQFTNTICHEIRNPLSAVFGHKELIEDKMKDLHALLSSESKEMPSSIKTAFDTLREEVQLSLDAIKDCADYAKSVTDDVLQLSKLENYDIIFEKEIFYPKTAILSVIHIFKPTLEKKGLSIEFQAPMEEIVVKGDKQRFQEIVINLVSNAIKFTQTGKITITLDEGNTSSTHTTLVCSVKDTGIGLTAEEKNKLFQRFSQASSSTYKRYGGSGLGLAICKNLVEKMQGTIEVESEKGQGAIFTFTICCDSVSPQEIQSQEQVISTLTQASPAPVDMSDKKILIVEDNVWIQKLITAFLKDRYQYELASDGVEAVNMASQAHYDLILMDIIMPNMDGFEATRHIREQEQASQLSATCIIALSGNAGSEFEQEARAAGMDDYFVKPIKTKEDLYKIIDRHLQQTENISEGGGSMTFFKR